ncbi:LPS assembly lipoprotein LptE [Opitutus sp. ER46]|uniref:LPS assembly lipoprotein LptE n=1 Tax=Opitutus sp. ER46 TaxID=2161864 RepID=UPI001304BAED|nr:LPS assembly lipoprotein LptE [Opitutus sp. ER46]
MTTLRMLLHRARASAVVLPALAVLLTIGLFTGCSHYRLGTGATPPFRTLYVEPVANTTLVPQAREIVSARLREAFIRDGRIAIANSPGEADATLIVVITGYNRTVAAVREGDTGLARKFDLTLGVDCTLRQRDGTVLFERRHITATRASFTDRGQLQSELQTLPYLADALSDKITHAALDVW